MVNYKRRSGFRKSGYRKRSFKRRSFRRSAYGKRKSSPYKDTKLKVPTRYMTDYTLVKLKDSCLVYSDVGSVPAIGDHSYANITISGSDLYGAFLLEGSGAQPMGFSQWMAFYKNFIVHKSSIKVTPTAWNMTGGAGNGHYGMPFQITITPVTVASLTSANRPFDQQPYSKFKTFTGASLSVYGSTDGIAPNYSPGVMSFPSLYNSMMTKKMLGIKDLTDFSDVQGTATASPAEVFYWNIEVRSLIQRPAGSASGAGYQLGKLDLKIDIFYKCHFLNRNTGLDTTNPGGGTEDEP